VGQGASQCTQKAILPIALSGGFTGTFSTGIVDDSSIPALLGLEAIESNRMLIDAPNKKLYLLGAGGYSIQLSPGSTVLPLFKSESGHLMLKASEWANVKPDPDKVITFVTGIEEDFEPESAADTSPAPPQEFLLATTIVCSQSRSATMLGSHLLCDFAKPAATEATITQLNPSTVYVATDTKHCIGRVARKQHMHDVQRFSQRQLAAKRHIIIDGGLWLAQKIKLKRLKLIFFTGLVLAALAGVTLAAGDAVPLLASRTLSATSHVGTTLPDYSQQWHESDWQFLAIENLTREALGTNSWGLNETCKKTTFPARETTAKADNAMTTAYPSYVDPKTGVRKRIANKAFSLGAEDDNY
jgi:hypothetical protein